MAVKASIREISRRIGSAVRDFATSQGLDPRDYALVGAFDENTDRISLFFSTNQEIDGRQYYAGILNAIRDAFPEFPQITMQVGLVLSGSQAPEELHARFYVNEHEVDMTEWLERI
jgi:hypothetical protein